MPHLLIRRFASSRVSGTLSLCVAASLSLIFPRSSLWAEEMRHNASDDKSVFIPTATPSADDAEAGHATAQPQKKKDDPLEAAVKHAIGSLLGGDVNALLELTALPKYTQGQKLYKLGLFLRRYFSSQLIADHIEIVEIKRIDDTRATVKVKVFRVPVNAPRRFSGTSQTETWPFVKEGEWWFLVLEDRLLAY